MTLRQSDKDLLRKSRIENFKVGIRVRNYGLMENEFELSITHNGYQWNSITLSPEEGRRIIAVISHHLRENDL